MYYIRQIKIRAFIPISFFISPILIYCLTYATTDSDKSSVPEKSQQQIEEQFKKAVSLINTRSYKEAEDILLSFSEDNLWYEKVYFLLGRLYKDQGILDKAEGCFKKVVEQRSLLKDYALKLLVDVYITREEFNKAIESARQIQNKILIQEAKQSEINALLALKDEETATKVLSQYVMEYPMEWGSKLLLAKLLRDREKEMTISLLKDIYINATPFAADALKELEMMDEGKFTKQEKLKRAESLFTNGSFQSAESAYKELLKDIDDAAVKDRIRFSIATCQFKQKKYDMAAKNFGLIKGHEAMYWRARVLYRIDDIEGFEGVIKRFKKEYPKDQYLAKLLLILADEKRKAGKLNEAEEIFRKILNDFPDENENAFWGLGWMNYTNGNYKEAEKVFSKLISSVKNNGQYLYWQAKSREMLSKECMLQKVSLNSSQVNSEREGNACPGADDVYSELLKYNDYYGFLVKAQLKEPNAAREVKTPSPKIPEEEVYTRIEMLRFLGMNREAIEEIKMALRVKKDIEGLRYLGQTAIELGEYKSIIYFVEGIKDEKFLSLAYPLGFWDTVKGTAESEGIDPYLVVALIREESRFDPGAVSAAGAIGLMQLMPLTAHRIKKEINMELKDNSELYDVGKNISMGTHYFSLLVKEFGRLPLAIAAYNSGENALRKWLFDSKHKNIEEFIEDIPYKETRNYVKKVLRSYWQYRAMNGLSIEGF